MITAVALLITVVTFVFIVSPFFRRARPAAMEGDGRIRDLESQRDTTYSMLKELEFDFQSGVLTEADYRDLEARYKNKAISVLKDMDATAGDDTVDDDIEKKVHALRSQKTSRTETVEAAPEDEIEKQVLALRGKKASRVETAMETAPEDEVEDQVRALRSQKSPAETEEDTELRVPSQRKQQRFCTQCGSAAAPEDLFCAHCGTKLTRGGRRK